MITVPLNAAVLALKGAGRSTDVLTQAGRRLGDRVEIDLEQLGPEDAQTIEAYYALCREFWNRIANDQGAGNYVAVRNELLRVQQRNTKTEKRDLTEQLTALDEVPGLGDVVDALTEAEVDLDEVERLGAPFAVTVSQEGSWTTAVLAVEGVHPWSSALGGAPAPGEVRRIITLRTSQAAWRDRRNRRLAEVTVVAEEIWPAAG